MKARSPRIIAVLKRCGFTDEGTVVVRTPGKGLYQTGMEFSWVGVDMKRPEGMTYSYEQKLVSSLMAAYRLYDKAPSLRLQQAAEGMIETLVHEAKVQEAKAVYR